MALEVIEREAGGRLLFAVGGSGFYIQALEKGMFEIDKSNPETEREVREFVAQEGLAKAHALLQELDPEYAKEVNPQDAYRITRGIVIIRDSGKKVSELRLNFKAKSLPCPVLKIGFAPSREELLPRIEKRTEQMLQRGLLDEVKQLLAEGFAGWPPLNSVGYKECVEVLQGGIAESELKQTIILKTMQLAKKQRTWFKRDKETFWLNLSSAKEQAVSFLDPLKLKS